MTKVRLQATSDCLNLKACVLLVEPEYEAIMTAILNKANAKRTDDMQLVLRSRPQNQPPALVARRGLADSVAEWFHHFVDEVARHALELRGSDEHCIGRER